MYNRATEIVPLLNLLLLNDDKESFITKGHFKNGSLTKKEEKTYTESLSWLCIIFKR